MSTMTKANSPGKNLAKTSLLFSEAQNFPSEGTAPAAWSGSWPLAQLPAQDGPSVLSADSSSTMSPASADAMPPHVPGELIVTFSVQSDTAAREAGIAKAMAAIGGSLKEVLITSLPGQAADHPLVARVAVGQGMALEKAAEVLSKLPGVQSVDLNSTVSVQATSNDPSYLNGDQWGMYGDDPLIGPVDNRFGSQADEAWAAGYTGSTKVVVGVVDTGIDYLHPDLYLNIWLNQGEIATLSFRNLLQDTDGDGLITFYDLNNTQNRNNPVLASFLRDFTGNGYIDARDLLADSSGWEDGIDNDADGYVDDLIGWNFIRNDNDPLDDNGHGTNVAGIIGAVGGNATMVAGVNWRTQLLAIKSLGSTGIASDTALINGLNYYANVSKTASATQHFVATNNSWKGGVASAATADAIVRTAREGALFVTIAGNEGKEITEQAPTYPSSYSTLQSLGYESIISVAALDSTGQRASYSNYGSNTVDLAAPGSNILSTIPGAAVSYNSGTSMAGPFVSGALAMYAAEHPELSNQRLRAALLTSVAPTDSLQGITMTGGRLDVAAMMSKVITASDVVAPTLSITLNDYAISGSETALVTFQFSESVKGFDKSDVLLGSAAGSLSDFTALALGNAYTAIFTPFASTTDGTNTISVRSGSYWDSNFNLGLDTPSANFTVDSTAGSFYIGTNRNDVITGSSLGDKLSGVPANDTSLGKGTVDQLSGKAGADLFVLGDGRGNFYDDGSSRSSGTKDYAHITDFNPAEGDRIQVKAGDYLFLSSTINKVAGTSLYVDTKTLGVLESSDEMIGFLVGVSPADMSTENLLLV